MREWEIGAVENIHGALPYIRFAPLLALVGVGVNRIGKQQTIEFLEKGAHADDTKREPYIQAIINLLKGDYKETLTFPI